MLKTRGDSPLRTCCKAISLIYHWGISLVNWSLIYSCQIFKSDVVMDAWAMTTESLKQTLRVYHKRLFICPSCTHLPTPCCKTSCNKACMIGFPGCSFKVVAIRWWIFSKNNTRVDVAVFVLANDIWKVFCCLVFSFTNHPWHPPSFHCLSINFSTTPASLKLISNALSICCSRRTSLPPRVLDLVLPPWILSLNGEHKPSQHGEHQPSQTEVNQLDLWDFASIDWALAEATFSSSIDWALVPSPWKEASNRDNTTIQPALTKHDILS